MDSWEEENRYELLVSLFPTKDKQYLRLKSIEFNRNAVGLQNFIESQFSDLDAEIIPDEPTLNENPVKTEIDWTFNPEDFTLKYYPNPYDFFKKCVKSAETKENCLNYMKIRYKYADPKIVETAVKNNNYNMIEADLVLQLSTLSNIKDFDNTATSSWAARINATDILIDEIKLVENKKNIDEYLELREVMRFDAKLKGELLSCECCFGVDILPNEMLSCDEGHIFCCQCVKTYVEVMMGQNKVDFQCLAECNGKLPMNNIKVQAYTKLVAKIQEAEIRAANIPGIEHCQFCEFAMIPSPENKIFKCGNCKIEICRICKKLNHIPLKCGETIQDDRKRRRLASEEEQTSKVVRLCPTCKVEIMKISGCNVVQCRCRTFMCYLCGAAIVGLADPHSHM